ncbi:hypothetical protein HY630_01260 [Candidatus Uhrbacteria bacterium]|nr:hypothetical protein [Candidatus Uhrbacteria bacterium]
MSDRTKLIVQLESLLLVHQAAGIRVGRMEVSDMKRNEIFERWAALIGALLGVAAALAIIHNC